MNTGDGRMTLGEALAGTTAPRDVLDALELVPVPHISFDGAAREGQLVVHRDLADDVRAVFAELSERRFPIAGITPIVAYGWDDEASMLANNSSAFNYRAIAGTEQLSNHSFGRAIDINPFTNPFVRRDGSVVPQGATYDPEAPGAITPEIALLFISRGWSWGGEWTDRKDWQHFEKTA